MQELLTVMRRLRAPDGCPWDKEQTHESLRPYLLEEAAEAADAVGNPTELADELGDVLLQVAFHSVIAEQEGTFDYAAVERGIVAKLVRRHPHVFGGLEVSGSGEVVSNWQAIKLAERGGKPRSAAERVPASLGALAREAKAQKLAVQAGLEYDSTEQDSTERDRAEHSRARLSALLASAPDTEAGVAEVLAGVVAWASSLGIDAELALRSQTNRTLAALSETAE